MVTYFDAEGRIIIPSELLRKYKITPKTKLEILDTGTEIVIRVATDEKSRRINGLLKNTGALNDTPDEKPKK